MSSLRDAMIVEVTRTPIGKYKQSLSGFEAPTLAAMTMRNILDKAQVDPSDVDEVIFGNLFNYDWGNLARIAWLEAGLPQSVPAVTVNRQCASSLNAVAFGASMIMTGAADVVLAGGVESYSKQPYLVKRPDMAFPANLEVLPLKISSPAVGDPPMIMTAENIASQYRITREECDAFALSSHQKAASAWDRGFYNEEIFPVTCAKGKKETYVFEHDESLRRDTSLESLGMLRPVMVKDGVVTAGNSSPMNDGASAVLLCSREKARQLGLSPYARVAGFASAGVDPNIMGIGPVNASRKLMAKYHLTIDDFDIVELNEAFAAQSIACARELNINPEKLNPHGGAIALGHPNAASGGILVARTVRYMREKGLKRGLISFCVGGGQGFSCMLEQD